MTFEQAGYALGIGFALIGLLMRLKASFTNKDLLLLAFFGYICIAGYTTTLAYIPLVTLLLLFIVLKKPIKVTNLILVAMTILTWISSIIVTLDFRDDLRLTQNDNIETTASLSEPLSVMINQHARTDYTSDIGLIIWIVILLAMLTYKFKLLGIITLTWIIGVISFSLLSAGYASPESTFALYRTKIIIPVILGLLVYNNANFFNHKYLFIFTLVIALSGIYYQYEHFTSKSENKSAILYEIYNKLDLHLAETPAEILLIDLDEEPYLPVKDGVGYFLPRYEIHFEDDLCNLGDYTESYLISKSDLSTIGCYLDYAQSIRDVNSFRLESNDQNFLISQYEIAKQ